MLATAVGFETSGLPAGYEAMEVFDRYRLRLVRFLNFLVRSRRLRPDIIHIQGALHPVLYLLLWQLLAFFSSGKFVYTSHDILPKYRKRCNTLALERIYTSIPRIVVHAQKNRDLLLSLFDVEPGNIIVHSIGNNLGFLQETTLQESRLQEPCPDDENKKKETAREGSGKRLLFFGVIEPQKGLMWLIRAMKLVSEKHKDACLLIAGQPFEDISAYELEIEALGLGGCVTIRAGYIQVKDIPAVFSEADIVVLPYEDVSQSGVVLTAYGFGKPVIATDVGGLSELIQDGVTGLLVEPRNTEALARAILRLIEDTGMRNRMAAACLEALRAEHSWESIAKQTEDMYLSLSECKA